MGKIKTFAIELINSSGIFHQEDTVSGKVVLSVEDDLKLRDITLSFLGSSNVHWAQRKGTSRSSQVIHYRAEEIYFEKEISMVTKGEKEILLNTGHHEYNFSFRLPKNIPTSYESKIGQVRYSLKASIDRPWAFDAKVELPITVLTPLDLNIRDDAKKFIENEDMRILCCWCCKSDPIIGKLYVDRMGYVPGEAIRPKVECVNKSSRKMVSIEVSLLQVVSYHTRSKTKSVEHTVTQQSIGSLRKGRSLSVDGIRLIVPPLPPSDLEHCNIIDIKYYVELLINPRKPALALQFRVPVVIGSIPLNSSKLTKNSVSGITQGIRNSPHEPSPRNGVQNSISNKRTIDNLKHADAPSYAVSVFGPSELVSHKGKSSNTNDNSVRPHQNVIKWAPSYSYYS